MKKVLFVSKDMGGANIAASLAEEFIRGGHSVTIIGEGLASAIFQKRGLSLYFKGSVNFLEEPFTLDTMAVIKKINPDILICTNGNPINLEEQFGLAANTCGIPLVSLEDFWGSFVRSKARPDVILTVDEYSKSLALKDHPNARIAVVGNPGVIGKDELSSINTHLLDHLKGNSAKKIFTYIGGDYTTTIEQLDLLIKCLEITSISWLLAVRFHPKWVKFVEASGRSYGEIWNEALSPVKEKIIVCDDLSTLEVVVNSDLVLSSYSTLLTTAVISGKPVITLFTPSVKKSLKKESVVDKVPLVTLGYAYEVKEPCDLKEFQPSKKSLDGLRPYDPNVAYSAIINLF